METKNLRASINDFIAKNIKTEKRKLEMKKKEIRELQNNIRNLKKQSCNSEQVKKLEKELQYLKKGKQAIEGRLKTKYKVNTDGRGRPKKTVEDTYKAKHSKLTCYIEPDVLQNLKQLKVQGAIPDISFLINHLCKQFLDESIKEKQS